MANGKRKGLLIVHTGDGKGKTTAALGLALRAAGQGMRVCIVQFIKADRACGELKALKRFDDLVDVRTMGVGFIPGEPTEEDRAAALEAWALAAERIAAGAHDMVVLDELTYLISLKMVAEADILAALAARPAGLHVVVTGRGASPALIAAADLVTDMTALKHPHTTGAPAQKGIEY